MNAIKLLENIKLIRARKNLAEERGERDLNAEYQISCFENCKNALHGRERKVLELYYEKDFTQAQVATEIGVSTSTVTRVVKEIKEKFKIMLQ
jgi:RNA polymerase sigma factor (sigma-70 family)